MIEKIKYNDTAALKKEIKTMETLANIKESNVLSIIDVIDTKAWYYIVLE